MSFGHLAFAIPLAAAATAGIVSLAASAESPPVAVGLTPLAERGRVLYRTNCTSCHGNDGGGVEGRGPTLEDEGDASVDFVLRTGRMPIAQPDVQATRGPVQFTEEEVVALIAYAGGFGDGPAIPGVDVAAGDVVAGGVLYRLNCAACHVASGSGAAIGGGREAPSMMPSTPTEVAEAVLVGPGAMPVFGALDEQDRDDLAAYVVDLQERNEEIELRNFGGAGPVAEGLAAWLLALIPLVALTRWIGSPHAGRDRGANPPVDEHGEVVT
ncbi:MAG: c-type cytochrome [Acidimicrobiia bacterium]|nr:c-type cytochrome [Acidimicrobiia bacterium]